MKLYKVAFYSTVMQRKTMIIKVQADSIEHARQIAEFDYAAIYFQYVEQVY